MVMLGYDIYICNWCWQTVQSRNMYDQFVCKDCVGE